MVQGNVFATTANEMIVARRTLKFKIEPIPLNGWQTSTDPYEETRDLRNNINGNVFNNFTGVSFIEEHTDPDDGMMNGWEWIVPYVRVADLQVDSLNQNPYGGVSGSDEEDAQENPEPGGSATGKMVLCNTAPYSPSSDKPGWADFTAAPPERTPFATMHLFLQGFPAGTQMRLIYDGNDPAQVTQNPDGSWFMPTGTLRVWTKNVHVARSMSDYIQPNAAYSFEDLKTKQSQVADGHFVFYVEGVRGSTQTADQTVKVQVKAPGSSWVDLDTVSFTSVAIEMTWEAQPGYDNVEDNKKVTAVDSNDVPSARDWMQGKGRKIFPDRKNPTDNSSNRNRLILHIKAVVPNRTIYLKSFDVDDATPDSVDNDPAHKLDTNDKAGDANLDNSYPRPGKFVTSGSNTATVTLNQNGEAQVQFETTKQPGDNFRVAATFNQGDLTVLQVSSPNGKGFIDGDSDKQPSGFNGVASPMLTVWRRLWCEFDSMGPPSQQQDGHENFEDVQVGTENAYMEDYPEAGQSTLGIFPPLSEGDDRFENGKLYIGGTPYTIISNSIQGGMAIVTIEGKPGSGVLGTTVRAYDDDVSQLGSRAPRNMPYQLSGGSLIYTAYADAFIEPTKVPENYIQTNVDFKRNLNVTNYQFDWAPVVLANLDLTDTEDFWVIYLLCTWQPSEGGDKDPDSEASSGLGQSDPGGLPGLKKNMGTVYIETTRELERLPITPRIEEYHTVVHEIGHQGSGKHTDGGIMADGAPSNENQFKPITIKRFRENQRF